MWVSDEPIYRKGKFYSAGEPFDAPESAVASFIKKGIVHPYAEESHEKPAAESVPPVVEAPVETPPEQAMEKAEEEAPVEPKEEPAKAPKTPRKAAGRKASAPKKAEEE